MVKEDRIGSRRRRKLEDWGERRGGRGMEMGLEGPD
jgi:hypothetical protein